MKKYFTFIVIVLVQFLKINAQNPISHWSFNHANAQDEGQAAINGTLTDILFKQGMDCDTGAWFNGSTSGIDFGNNLNNIFTRGSFSISLWVKPYSYYSNDAYKDLSMIIQKWRTAELTDNTFILYLSQFVSWNKKIDFIPPPLNTWSHMAVINNSGNIKIYINGKLVGSGEGFTFNTSTYPLMLGTLHNNRYKYYGGLDDVRIYNYALSENEVDSLIQSNKLYNQYLYSSIEVFKNQSPITIGVEAVPGYTYRWNNGINQSKIEVNYTPGFDSTQYSLTINTGSNCVYKDTTIIKWINYSDGLEGYWYFDDSSDLINQCHEVVNVSVAEGIGCKGSAMYFNGDNSYISMGDTLNNVFTGSNFTISVWVYLEDTFDISTNYYPMILSKWRSTGYNDNAFILYINNFTFGQDLDPNTIKYKYPIITWPTPELNKWHHYVVVKNKTITSIYLDGQLVATSPSYGIYNTTYPLVLGALHNNSYNLKGKIDDVRIYNRALSLEQISYLNRFGYINKLGKIPSEIKVPRYSDITLNAGDGYNSYLWSRGDTTQTITLTNVVKNMPNLSVMVIDSMGICYADTFNIVSQNLLFSHWSFNHSNAQDEGQAAINGTLTDILFKQGMDCDTGAWFNGSTSGIDFGNNLNNIFTRGSFSISLWVKPYSYYSNDAYKDLSMIIQKWRTAELTDNTFILYLSQFVSWNKKIDFIPPPLNTWSHMAVINDSGSVKIFINGRLVGEGQGFTFNASTYPLMLGTLHNNRYKYHGGLDDVRIYNYALSESDLDNIIRSNKLYGQYLYSEIEVFKNQSPVTIGVETLPGYTYQWDNGVNQSRFPVSYTHDVDEKKYTLRINTGNHCIYTDSTIIRWVDFSEGLQGYWNFNDSIELLNKSRELANVSTTEGIGCSNAMYFNGDNSYISMGDTLNNVFTGSDFTISVWTYLQDTFDVSVNAYPMILSKWRSTGYTDNTFILYINSFVFGGDSKKVYPEIRWSTPELGQWHHFVVVKKSKFTKVYLDGELIGSAIGYSLNSTSYPLVVGALYNNTYNLKGRIDDLRIYDKALSAEQIKYLNRLGYKNKLEHIPSEIKVAKYSTITLDAGSGYNSYLWSNGATTQTITLSNITEDIPDLSIIVIDSVGGCYAGNYNIVVQTTDIFDKKLEQNTLIYPNPVKDDINIIFKDQKAQKIEIFDVNSKLLQTIIPTAEKLSIDMSGFKQGIYFIKIRYATKTEVYKIILSGIGY